MKKCDRLEIDSRPRRIAHFPFFSVYKKEEYEGREHYVMVSRSQRKPFWLATQLDPQNDWTEWQKGVNDDVCALATVTNKKSQKNPGLQSIEGVASRKVTDLEA